MSGLRDEQDGRRSAGANPLAVVLLFLAALVGGVTLWLALKAEDTIAARRAVLPVVHVALPDLAPAAPEPATPPAVAAQAEPEPIMDAPAPVEAAETAEPAAVVAEAAPEPEAEPEAVIATPAPEAAPSAEPEPATTQADEPPVPTGGYDVPSTDPKLLDGAPAPAASPSVPVQSTPIETASLPPADPAPGPAVVEKLPPAPLPGLTEGGASGLLPRVAADGRQPWQVYARPFDAADPQPRIAIVITELGLASAQTETAIQRMPGAVTLAFDPRSRRIDEWIGQARAAGHEVLLSVPMEPATFPRDDPGPKALLTTLGGAENISRLEWALARAQGYVGVTDWRGTGYLAHAGSLEPVFEVLKRRGLLFVDSGATPTSASPEMARQFDLPHVTANRFIDRVAARDAVDAQLRQLEEEARRTGYAVGFATPLPVSFERLALWLPTLKEKGITLAPVSALVDKSRTAAAQ